METRNNRIEKATDQFIKIPILSPIRTTNQIKNTINLHNDKRKSRYGSTNALNIDAFVMKSNQSLLPLPLKYELDRHDEKQLILYPRSVAAQAASTSTSSTSSTTVSPLLPRKRPNLPLLSTITTSESISTATATKPLDIHHHNALLMHYYKNKNIQQKVALNKNKLLYRNKMIEHRLREISLTREGIREELSSKWENTLRFRLDEKNNAADAANEGNHLHYQQHLTNNINKMMSDALKFGFLPGSRKKVKKSMYLDNYRLNEYWRQMEVQRAKGITKVSNAPSSKKIFPNQKKVLKSKEKEKEKMTILDPSSEKKNELIIKPKTIKDVNSILDLFLYVVWRAENIQLIWAMKQFVNNVITCKLKNVIQTMLNYYLSTSWKKWKVTDMYLRKKNINKMKRHLSFAQIQNDQWRKELMKQLTLKKFCYGIKNIKLRDSFNIWYDMYTPSGGQTLTKRKRDQILNEASKFPNVTSPTPTTSNRRRSSSADRRLSIREQVPSKMIVKIQVVSSQKSPPTPRHYKNTGMTAEELLKFALGKKENTSKKIKRIPSKKYFLQRAKQKDFRYRTQKVNAILPGKLWCR